MFICVDTTFFAANFLKVFEGGWVPLALAFGTYIILITWRRGSLAVAKAMRSMTIPVDVFFARLQDSGVPRVPGTAVFLSKTTDRTPPLIIWHVAHNRALHQQVVALSIVVTQTPWVREEDRLTVELIAPNFWRLIGYYGFMERPNIPTLLKQAQKAQTGLNLNDVVYYVGHETVLPTTDVSSGMPMWQERLYAILRRNSAQVHQYLRLPRESVVEIGRQIEI